MTEQAPKPDSFLIARDLFQANLTAVIDWGWTRVDKERWETPNGELVTYIHNLDDLRGVRNRTLYIGYGFDDRRSEERQFIITLLELGWLKRGITSIKKE